MKPKTQIQTQYRIQTSNSLFIQKLILHPLLTPINISCNKTGNFQIWQIFAIGKTGHFWKHLKTFQKQFSKSPKSTLYAKKKNCQLTFEIWKQISKLLQSQERKKHLRNLKTAFWGSRWIF